jgi:zinc protease
MAKNNLTLALPGIWETNSSVGSAIGEMVQFGLPPDYFSTYARNIRALNQTSLNTATEKVIRPDSLVWVIVGDLSRIEKGVRELNLGDVVVVDADGNPTK